MLDFWLIGSDENVKIVEGCIEGDIVRPPDFRIEIEAFHLAFNNGLEDLAIEVGLSYFEDALLSPASSNRILNCLIDMDLKKLPSAYTTEALAMQRFFSLAVGLEKTVCVICD